MSYSELVREEPPENARSVRKTSRLHLNLVNLATTPGEWGRIGTYTNKKAASQTTYDLRDKKRKVPPGTWEFSYGAVPGNHAKFGVWARLIAIESNGI